MLITKSLRYKNNYSKKLKATSVSAETDHAAILAQTMAYVRDQNELSEIEPLTIGASESTATQMQYDGFIIISVGSTVNGSLFISSDNKQTWFSVLGTSMDMGKSAYALVRKGDYVWAYAGASQNNFARYYKKRDYSNR